MSTAKNNTAEEGSAADAAQRIAGVVLAAGSSRRLGQPKQLLPYRSSTLLDVTLDTVRSFGLAQLLVTLGGASSEVAESVNLDGFTIVDSLHYTNGCSSSIVASLDLVSDNIGGIFLFLGDQPHVSQSAVASLRQASANAPIAVVEYNDGRGHPFWFDRSMFSELANLHGDKAVWKLLESGRWPIGIARVDEETPLDVDTWEDYETLQNSE